MYSEPPLPISHYDKQIAVLAASMKTTRDQIDNLCASGSVLPNDLMMSLAMMEIKLMALHKEKMALGYFTGVVR